jgi:Mg-chelatase subunit ChlD
VKTDSDYHEAKENIKISFRLDNKDDTRLLYQKSSKYPGEVAVMAAFLPTFEKSVETEKTKICVGDLEDQDLADGIDNKYQYIFLVDRSGSMGTNNRMQITNDAVVLFLQSLPKGSKFGILGFGSDCKWE